MKIEKLRELLAKATPGPWPPAVTASDNRDMGHARGPEHPRPSRMSWHPQTEADAALISAMRDTLPALLDVAEAARTLVEGSGYEAESNQELVIVALAKLSMVPNVHGDE